jgi:hypothetical protein
MEVNNQENSKEKSKLSLFLIVWSTFNMIMGVLFFAIPALIYSILFRNGQHEFRIKAIVFNAVSTVVGLAAWIYIIIYLYNYIHLYISI